MDPLPPLPTLPPLNQRRRKGLLSWATAIALFGALAAGIFHALGAKLFERAWTYLNLP
ncbi:MAG: hypothetical protein WC684_00535 [Hyphomicrobium sp.]|jgi:hypothetical protein